MARGSQLTPRMSLTELFAGAPYRSNDSGIRACRDDALEAWKSELATDAQLLLPIVARRCALALTAPLVILSGFIALFAKDFMLLRIPGQLALPAFFVLSWAARVVLAARLARPLRQSDDALADLRRLAATSPLDQLAGHAARLAPWSRSAAMILGALVVPLVPLAIMPYARRADLAGDVVVVIAVVAIFGLWTLPPLFVRAFQVGFATRQRGYFPLTVVCALLWTGLSLMGGVVGVLLVLASGGVMYFVFGLAERVLRRRVERQDTLIALLLRRRAASAR
jgi:hypothetical protein